jgi:GTP-dependent dephospho-CoA kinase
MPLKDEHINILKKPFGKLIKQEEVSKQKIFGLLNGSKTIITVGDATTEKIISFGLMPNLAIIDGIERRIKRTELEILHLKNTFLTKNNIYNHYECKNIQGTISKEAYLIIKKILIKEEKAIIFIDGEEDLLALPVFALAPIGAIVFYGQPLEGLVMVKINDDIKNKSTNLINSIGIE